MHNHTILFGILATIFQTACGNTVTTGEAPNAAQSSKLGVAIVWTWEVLLPMVFAQRIEFAMLRQPLCD